MALVPLVQVASWPGVVAIESLQYTISHGITPGLAILRTYPQRSPIASSGNLVIGDGQRSFILQDCRVSRLTSEAGPQGQTWTLEIQDRRWRWPGLAAVSGSYNQLDNRGKLVPWTIRSPYELAVLCLKAMGETGYAINLPNGLPASVGKDVNRYLQAGENFAQSLANPEVSWDHTPPAQALAQLADLYGCRVVYQPLTNRVIVTPTGIGQTMPDGPCESISGGAENPRVPYAVAIAGAPVRIQARFALEPVGEEWDGRYVPIDDLSYAPKVPAQVQISSATFSGTGNPSYFTVTLTFGGWALNAVQNTYSATSATSGTVAGKLAAIAAQINADPNAKKYVSAAATATAVTVTGLSGGLTFGLEAFASGLSAPPDKFQAALVQPAGPANGRSWRYSNPPTFPNVIATDRLSYSEAQNLARKSVFRCYRLLLVDPHRGTVPYTLPWYKGKLVRRQQLILQPTKVAQVMPAPRQPGARNMNNPIAWNLPLPGLFGGGVLPEFYNAYSRDQEATCTGSVYKHLGGQVFWLFDGVYNTAVGDRVRAGFSIDPYEQVVSFADYIYAIGEGGAVLPSGITLETACLVQDADTGQLVRWEAFKYLGGTAPIEWQIRDDVKVGVIGDYFDDPNPNGGARNALIGWEYAPGDLNDANGRASYYLQGMAAKYQLPQSDTRSYIGIYPTDPDGIIQQVSYSVSGVGPSTMISANSEFSISIPNYPNRRRSENLPPNQAAALANQLERAAAAIPDPKATVPQAGIAKFAAMAGLPPS